MKSKYRYKAWIAVALIILFTAGCKKFVQIGPPNIEVVTASVFDNNNEVTAAMLAIYLDMFTNTESYKMADNQGLLSDELINYSTRLPNIQFYKNSMLAIDNNGDWDNAYYYIYQVNAIIAGLQNNGNITPPIVQQITGEAKFIRAFWHFYLTNMYGDVPVVTTTAYTVNESISRAPRVLVYKQIIQDLTDAETLLNANYVDASDTVITTERVRPTKAAAEAMLARAYLYTQKYDSAVAAATSVINNTNLYSLDSNLSSLSAQPNYGPNSVFTMNNTEAIWQLATPPQVGYNTNDADNFVLTSAPGTGSSNSATISLELLNSFEPGDLRRTNWIDSVIKSGITYYFPFKYQQTNRNNPSNTSIEYETILRLAEQYLIRAEAEANLGDMADAASDLNKIRARANLPPSTILTSTSSLQQADSAILHERRVELFSEWGHRWFDLNRTGAVSNVMGAPGNVCQLKGGVWNSDWELYPIPTTEILKDPNLTQNAGY